MDSNEQAHPISKIIDGIIILFLSIIGIVLLTISIIQKNIIFIIITVAIYSFGKMSRRIARTKKKDLTFPLESFHLILSAILTNMFFGFLTSSGSGPVEPVSHESNFLYESIPFEYIFSNGTVVLILGIIIYVSLLLAKKSKILGILILLTVIPILIFQSHLVSLIYANPIIIKFLFGAPAAYLIALNFGFYKSSFLEKIRLL